jgi:hypothetical protein
VVVFRSLIAASLLASCAATSVTPISANQVVISTSAAPACGMAGAQKVAAQMAAVETLRRGFERFAIAGMGGENNVRVIQRAPTYAYTTGSIAGFGNTAYGSATTTYGGGGPMVLGSNDASLLVVMYRKGDQGYRSAVDARATLGDDWEQKVKQGINTCG